MKSEKNTDILCETCSKWVKCKADKKAKVNEHYGFCLWQDLFTYTNNKKCSDYCKGNPMTEQEWEKCQRNY